MIGLLAEGENPNDYGFAYSKKVLKRIIHELNDKIEISKFSIPYYKDIQQKIRDNRHVELPKELGDWLASTDFDKINDTFSKKLRKKIVHIRKLLKI